MPNNLACQRLCACGNPVRKQRKECNTCRARRYVTKVRRIYTAKKQNAQRRRINFAIPYPCFKLWCAINGLPNPDLTIDRIHETRAVGYVFANMQTLTWEDNQTKRGMTFQEACDAGYVKGYIDQPF